MKNLEVLHQIYKYCDFIKDAIEDECDLSDIHWTIINPDYKSLDDLEAVIVCNGRMYQVSLSEQNDTKCSLLPKYGNSKFCVVGLEYCVTVNQLYLAYESGEIVRISLKEFTHKEKDVQICEHDLAIKLDTKLHCMKLSPDQEIIIVVTDEGNVITILDFEIISEANLHLSDFGEKQFITVGWGKKETQFHGSEGKTAARAKQEQLHVNTSDSGRPRISWRGDGILFAVSFVHATTNVRQFKVFNREGVLQYTSEPTDGLEECLSWKPSGELIASTCQKYDNYGNASEHVVTCFEKNGLNHNYEQPSVGQRVTVKDLFWSPDSEILTVICKRLDTDNTELQLWTENNCTWYLKQVMIFYKNDPLIHAAWSVRASDKSYKKELILLTLRGLTYCLFTWRVNHNRCETTNDRALIGVIQGETVLLTDFKTAVVPPPWGQTHVALKEPVNAIVFAPNGKTQVDSSDVGTWMDSSVFCTVSCGNTLTFFKKMPKRVLTYDVLNVCNIECDIPNIKKCIDSGRIHHFSWLTENSMLCIATGDSCSYLCEVVLHKIGTENGRVMIRHSRKLDYDATHLVPTDDENVTYLLGTHCVCVIRKNDVGSTLDCEGCEELYSVEQIDDEFESDEHENEVKYYQVEHARIDSKHVLVALGHRNVFYIDHKAVANNITSFYVHSGFLLLTTEESLICVPLSKSGLTQLTEYDLNVQPWNLDRNGCTETKFSEGIYMRRIERGSQIVAAIAHTSKVLLQAPRGNLECIRPRPMSLHIIGRHLDERDYRTAFEIMRVERINLNFIHDHDPRSFTDNAEKFVNDIADNPSWLTLFLADLENENVVRTMYANCFPDCSAQPATSENDEAEGNKVERVCKLLQNIMEQRHDAARLTEPILISLVKHQYKEGLERALGKVKSIRLMGNSKNSVFADNALRCLLHLVNIDVLYNIALGMYDFELTMFIASKSSKDPREYIPFLNNLRNLSDDNYMKYSIDMHLKRYDSALEHISKIPSKFDDECLKLIRDQKLYQSAIRLFEKSSVEHKKVAALYAEYLLTEKKHHQAGIMFYRSGDLRKALQAFSKSGCSWQEAIMVSTELKLSSADLRELYRDLVKQLQAERMYSDAATVLKDYLNDAEEAVAILCEGRIWKRAIRLALDIERLDLIETHIKPGVKEHAEDVLSKLSKKKELFLKLKSRLVSVREEMKQKLMPPLINDCLPLDDLIGKQVYNNRLVSRGEVMDVLSDASSDTTFSQSSQISSTSGKSYRSRKKARKQARKILCIKEGGMFEDVGLVFELHKIIDDMYKDRDETTQLVHLLMRFEFDESWNILNKTKEFFQLVKSSIPEIWNNSPTTLDKLENFMDKLSLQENIAGFNPRELSYCTKYPPEIDWKYYDLS